MGYPENLRYSKSHEWAESVGEGRVRVGLTDFAQEALGDLVFVNLPSVGDRLTAGESMGDVESVKAVSDVYSPVGGVVTAVNEELLDSPQMINENPYGAWLVEAGEASGLEELLDADGYESFLAEEG